MDQVVIATPRLDPAKFRDPARARLMTFNDVSHYADHPRRAGENLSRWWDADAKPRPRTSGSPRVAK